MVPTSVGTPVIDVPQKMVVPSTHRSHGTTYNFKSLGYQFFIPTGRLCEGSAGSIQTDIATGIIPHNDFTTDLFDFEQRRNSLEQRITHQNNLSQIVN
jgi:hypothetical protein